MVDRYIFIDESGDLGEEGSKYFVIAAIWTDRPELFDRLIKNVRRNKFKKVLKGVQEIKANNSKQDLRMHLLKQIANMDGVHCHIIVLKKRKLYSVYLKNNKHKLYNYVCGVLASSITLDAKHLVIRIDRSKDRQALQRDFNQYLDRKLKENRWNVSVKIHHSWSHGWSGLQLVDFILLEYLGL